MGRHRETDPDGDRLQLDGARQRALAAEAEYRGALRRLADAPDFDRRRMALNMARWKLAAWSRAVQDWRALELP